MALADFDTYKAKVRAPYQPFIYGKQGMTTLANKWGSGWRIGPEAAGIPSTAAAPTNATTGAMAQFDATGAQWLAGVDCGGSLNGNGCVMMADRLSHQGGLSGTVTTAQSTNLPTAALTRYTDAVGVWGAFEIYTQIGTTATTITCSYTNSAGTAGRTSIAITFGATNNREAGRLLPFPLQAGDVGVKSVENVTVLATTGTAGNFGVTLFRPLFFMPVTQGMHYSFDGALTSGGNLQQIVNGAAIFYSCFQVANDVAMYLTLIEE